MNFLFHWRGKIVQHLPTRLFDIITKYEKKKRDTNNRLFLFENQNQCITEFENDLEPISFYLYILKIEYFILTVICRGATVPLTHPLAKDASIIGVQIFQKKVEKRQFYFIIK